MIINDKNCFSGGFRKPLEKEMALSGIISSIVSPSNRLGRRGALV
jgi:hypothetical protein